jgi:hypothetical protein
MRSPSRMSRVLVSSLVLFTASGCHTWQPVRLEENPNAARRPGEIEVHLKSGSKIAVADPLIRGDSLYGLTVSERDLTTGKYNSLKSTAIATADIKSARAGKFSGGRTAALIVLTPILALATLILLWNLTGSGPVLAPEF